MGSKPLPDDRVDVDQINVLGKYRGDLDESERLQLVDREDNVILDFVYDDDWFVFSIEEGRRSGFPSRTLTVIDEHAETTAWRSRGNWRLSRHQIL